MKRLFCFLIGLAVAGAAFAATLESDITTQGRSSYFEKSITDQQFATMIRDYETVTAANTLLYSECGKIVFVSALAGVANTLPEEDAGCWFKFVVIQETTSGQNTVVTASSGNTIVGGVNELEVDTGDDGPQALIANPADTITFVSTPGVVGDWIECVSDGTYWYCNGQTVADGGITFTST